jgi:hypothetical protein
MPTEHGNPYQRLRLTALAGIVGEACSMTVQGGGKRRVVTG